MPPELPSLNYDLPTWRTLGTRLTDVLRPWTLPTATVYANGVGATRYAPHYGDDRHSHLHYEGFILLDGTVDLITPWFTQPLVVGHLMLYSPGAIHQWQTYEQSCLFLVFSFDLDRPMITPTKQRWPRQPELLWIVWQLCETVHAGAPDWAVRAHCLLGFIYSHLLNLIDRTAMPQLPGDDTPQLVQRVDELLHDHLTSPITLDEMAELMSMSARHLSRRYHALTGMTIHARQEAFRMERAAKLLRKTDLSVAEVAHMVGLQGAGYFSRRFRQRFDLTPQTYRLKVMKTT